MTRRKTRSQKAIESGPSSSEDDQGVENLIGRLSHKYQKNTRRKSPRISSKSSDPYEGDVDSPGARTGTESSDTPMSPDLYDFDQQDNEAQLKLVLSPTRKLNINANVAKPKRAAAKEKPQSPVPQRASKRKLPVEKQTKVEAKKRSITVMPSPIMTNSSLRRESKGKRASVSFSCDSGMFLSPSDESALHSSRSASTPCTLGTGVKSTSTPCTFTSKPTVSSTPAVEKVLESNDSCFGFSSMDSLDPLPSPVFKDVPARGKLKRIHAAAKVQVSSPELFGAMTYDGVKSKIRKKKSNSGSKKNSSKDSGLDEWASNINSEFNDIEMYELSIEG